MHMRTSFHTPVTVLIMQRKSLCVAKCWFFYQLHISCFPGGTFWDGFWVNYRMTDVQKTGPRLDVETKSLLCFKSTQIVSWQQCTLCLDKLKTRWASYIQLDILPLKSLATPSKDPRLIQFNILINLSINSAFWIQPLNPKVMVLKTWSNWS